MNNPNKWTDKKEFVKEYTINTLVNGSSIIWGNFFKNGNLKKTERQLYILENYNLQLPAVDSFFWSQPNFDIKNLEFKLFLDNKYYLIPFKDLVISYDTIKHGLFNENNTFQYFNKDTFLNPISRVDALLYDLQIINNTQDALAYFASRPVGGVLSKNTVNGVNAGAMLDSIQKSIQESKINGKSDYGAGMNGKGHIITTHEDLKYLSIYQDTDKIVNALINIQNNAKQNIRTAYNVPSDILEARNGKNQGSTFENQNMAEARFISNVCQSIMDNMCRSLTMKSPEYFKIRGTKLIASFKHLPSIVKGMELEKQESIKFQTEAVKNLLDANKLATEQGLTLNIGRYMKENGLEDLL